MNYLIIAILLFLTPWFIVGWALVLFLFTRKSSNARNAAEKKLLHDLMHERNMIGRQQDESLRRIVVAIRLSLARKPTREQLAAAASYSEVCDIIGETAKSVSDYLLIDPKDYVASVHYPRAVTAARFQIADAQIAAGKEDA